MGNIELFDQMASRYDTEERVQVARRIAATIRQRVGDGKGKRALDYGCGTGLVGLELAGLFDSLLLVDAAEGMVRQAQYKIEAAGLQGISAQCWDLAAETAPPIRVDYVVLAQVLLHIPEVPAMLSHLYDLLNEDGHLLIVDFNKDECIVSDKVHNGFDQAALIHQVKAAGFTRAEAATFYHGERLFMGKDASLFLLDAIR